MTNRVNKLSLVDKGYIAGIIDGEGTITLSVNQKGGTRYLAVTISGTEWSLISYLKESVGTGKITNKKTYKAHHSPSFTYSIHSRQALSLLRQIAPYLKTYKKHRADIVLQEYIKVTPRNGKYSSEQKREKEKFVERFFAITP